LDIGRSVALVLSLIFVIVFSSISESAYGSNDKEVISEQTCTSALICPPRPVPQIDFNWTIINNHDPHTHPIGQLEARNLPLIKDILQRIEVVINIKYHYYPELPNKKTSPFVTQTESVFDGITYQLCTNPRTTLCDIDLVFFITSPNQQSGALRGGPHGVAKIFVTESSLEINVDKQNARFWQHEIGHSLGLVHGDGEWMTLGNQQEDQDIALLADKLFERGWDPNPNFMQVLDSRDKCRTSPETYNGYLDSDGCPDSKPKPQPIIPDTDGDGILDSRDRCRTSPETYNGYLDSDGCPDSKPKPQPIIPDFVDPPKGAQHYLDRYQNEPAYRDWFDKNYPDYTIQEAIELSIPDAFTVKESKPIVPKFVDSQNGVLYYLDRYHNEPFYKACFTFGNVVGGSTNGCP